MIRIEGARIREARERMGLSQGQLAYKANTTVTQISRLENNQRPGAAAQIVGRIAAVLDVSVDFLLGMTDDPTSEHNGGLLDAQAAYLLQELEEILALLPPESREHIMRTAITLADAHRVAAEAFEGREQGQHA